MPEALFLKTSYHLIENGAGHAPHGERCREKLREMRADWLVIAISAAMVAGCGAERQTQTEGSSATAAAPPDAPSPLAQGERAFKPCAVCHNPAKPGTPEGDRPAIAPNLHDVIGRRAGTYGDFAYSKAMRESGIIWDEATLDRYIENPQKVVPRNRMSFAGEPDPARRAAIIAYLKALQAS